MPRKFIITGKVLFADDSRPLRQGRVLAFDRDLPSLEKRGLAPRILGEALLDANEVFQIEYGEEQFQDWEAAGLNVRRLTKFGPDLSFTVYSSQGRILDISKLVVNEREFRPDQIIFNAPTELKVDIHVKLAETAALSEYELLTGLLAPLIGDLSAAELTGEDLEYACRELGFDDDASVQSLIWLVRSAQLSRLTQIDAEAFYGWGRMGIPAMLEELCKIPEQEVPILIEKLGSFNDENLREALEKAIGENIIPAYLREQTDLIIRQLKRHGHMLREVSVRLADRETGQGLEGFQVTTFEHSGTKEDLGLDITGSDGHFSFVIYLPADLPDDAPERQFSFKATMPDGTELPESDLQSIRPNQPQGESVQVFIPIPRNPVPTLESLQQTGQLDLPAELVRALKEREMTSFAAIRRAGGLRTLSDLPPVDAAVLNRLDALADLDRVLPDIAASKGVLEKGYDRVSSIAKSDRENFVRNTHEILGNYKALEVHTSSSVQTSFLNHQIFHALAQQANGLADPALESAALEQEKCGCSDCEAAVSPLAYMVDLIRYINTHVRNDGVQVDLDFLVKHFYQPFDELSASCKSIERQVRHVRLSIEVLWAHLKNEGLVPSQGGHSEGERLYLAKAYTTLLNKIGSSYEEIRQAKGQEDRRALAERIGIDLSSGLPAAEDEINRLLFDVERDTAGKKAISEQKLEELFGLADTQRNPLSDGTKLGDAKNQIMSWELDKVIWNRNTDTDGSIFLSLAHDATANLYRLEIFMDKERTRLIALAESANAADKVSLLPQNGSGLFGTISYAYVEDSSGIEIVVVPRFFSWRLRQLRKQWSGEDRSQDSYALGELPVIDPDLISPDDIRAVEAGQPNKALDRWQMRRAEVDSLLAQTKSVRENGGADPDGGRDAMLLAVLHQSFAQLQAVKADLDQNTDIGKKNTAAAAITNHLHLTIAAFNRLMALLGAAVQPVEGWQEVYAILTQAQKAARFPAWIMEEQADGIELGPSAFWPALIEPASLPQWLAGSEARQAWQEALNLRSQPAIIDPDLVPAAFLLDPLHGPARELWKERYEAIAQNLKNYEDGLTAVAGSGDSQLDYFDSLILSVLKVPSARLLELDGRRQQGHKVTSELVQLTLDLAAFNYLIKFRSLLVNQAEVLQTEWQDVFSILVQAGKKRDYGRWQKEEAHADLTLSQDYFQLPSAAQEELMSVASAGLPKWRASLSDQRDWQDKLASRIDSERTVSLGMAEALDAAEEAALPVLRRYLIQQAAAPGASLDVAADQLTSRLLIDTQSGPCQKTTRVAQAIETLQLLLFRLRSEQIPAQSYLNAWHDVPAIRFGAQPHAVTVTLPGGQDTLLALTGEDSRVYSMFASQLGGGPWTVVGDDQFTVLEGADLSLFSFEEQGNVYLVAPGSDGRLYFTVSISAAPFLPWTAIGDFQVTPTTGIAIAGEADEGIIHVFVVGDEGNIHGNWWDGEWHEWLRAGGDDFRVSSGAILAAVSLKREVQLFVVGDESKIFRTSITENATGNWAEANAAPAGITFAPGAALSARGTYTGDQALELVVAANDGRLYRTSWHEMTGDWQAWQPQGELTVAQDQIVTLAGPFNELQLLAIGKDGGLYEKVQSSWQRIGDNRFNPAARPAVRFDHTGAEHMYIAQGNRILTASRPLPVGAWKLSLFSLKLWASRFDDEWKTIGSYATWRSYMLAFLYPENVMLPNFKRYKTPAFDKLVEKLRSSRNLTAGDACEAAKEYARYVKDVCSLSVEATCQTRTKMYKSGSCQEEAISERDLLYLFGVTPAGNVYISTYDSLDRTGYPQSPWKAWPFGEIAQQIGGAVAYTTSSMRRYIYLFFIKKFFSPPSATPAVKVSFARYDLNLQEWDASGVIDLSDPPVEDGKTLKLTVVQGLSDQYPPILQMWPTRSNKSRWPGFIQRALNEAGDGWVPSSSAAGSEWDSFTFDWETGHFDAEGKMPITAFHAVYGTGWGDRNARSNHQFVTNSRNKMYRWSTETELPGGGYSWLGLYVNGSADSYEHGNYKNLSVLAFYRNQNNRPYCARAGSYFESAGAFKFFPTRSNLVRVVPNWGAAAPGEARLVYVAKTGSDMATYSCPVSDASDGISKSIPKLVLPVLPNNESIKVAMPGQSQAEQAEHEQRLYRANKNATLSILSLLDEAYYLVPTYIALRLQASGDLAALDWFRTVYDYNLPPGQRKIYYVLKQEENLSDLYRRPDNWEVDPLDPHAVARTRRESYTRFTILSIARCLQDFADAEFTLDTPESVPRARELYTRELKLLESSGLVQHFNECDNMIGQLEMAFEGPAGEPLGPLYSTEAGKLIQDLRSVAKAKEMASAINKLQTVYADGSLSLAEKLKQSQSLITVTQAQTVSHSTFKEVLAAQEKEVLQQHAALLADPKLSEVMEHTGKEASRNLQIRLSGALKIETGSIIDFVNEAEWEIIFSPGIGEGIFDDIDHFHPLPAINYPSVTFCIPPNPVLSSLKLHAQLNLLKIRTCRNIAGLHRELDPYAAPTDTTSGLPGIGQGGQIVLSGISTIQPTLYRYPVLIERAKQLVSVAAQMEASLLAALEKKDQEAYDLLKARQDLGLADANVRLQTLRITEANHSITLAEKQKERAELTTNYFAGLIDEGYLATEQNALDLLAEAANAYASARTLNLASAITSFAAAVAAGADILRGTADTPFSHTASGLSAMAGHFSNTAAQNQADASFNQTLASYERRQQEWAYQLSLGNKDVDIAMQQITLAKDHLQIAEQERNIADLSSTYAKDTIEFLSNEFFTRLDLYEFMSKIFEDVYRYILQQATSMALLAQNQLAFVRQETPVAVIQTDYWKVPKTYDDFSTNAGTIDRKGMTGSARLLRDITELDQYAFNTDKRKLPLSKTISLALLAPSEFGQFIETGIMTFYTPMELFDRDFPGHYLRLIRRVRTTVVALIPPTQGIRATLTSSGLSRVVAGPDIFQTVTMRRDPEFVALTSPANATGVLEFEPLQTDMLLPFEGTGVDTVWEFRMPKAANPIDYRTIADVLITIDYTALDSYGYRQQVIQNLSPKLSADQAFSFKNKFADQWYDLHNPDQTKTPMSVRFHIVPKDFPPHLDNIRIQQILLHFVRLNDKSFELPITQLQFAEKGKQASVGGTAAPIDGVISTRRGNGSDWTDMIGKTPVGEWDLTLPNTEEARNLFKDEKIDDILLVITYSGRTPEWPA